MPALRELQQSFALAMLEDDPKLNEHIVGDGFSAGERLQVYRNTVRSALIAALGLTFPAVHRITGDTFFQTAAGEFLLRQPPGGADLNEYGGSFPAFLEAFAPASCVPYLGDVARFEWALSAAAHADDVPALDPASLANVDPQHHGALCFEPHPSVGLLALTYPADEIADAVLGGDDSAMAEVDLHAGPIRLVVHRGPGGVTAQRLDPPLFEFMRRMCDGEPLARLLESPGCDAVSLLAEQLTNHRLSGFRIQPKAAARGDS